MDLSVLIPLVYLSMYSCQLLSSRLIQASLAPIAGLRQLLDYHKAWTTEVASLYSLMSSWVFITTTSTSNTVLAQSRGERTKPFHSSISILSHGPLSLSANRLFESTLTGSAPLTGDTQIRTHCGFGRVRTAPNLELRTPNLIREFEIRTHDHKMTGSRRVRTHDLSDIGYECQLSRPLGHHGSMV